MLIHLRGILARHILRHLTLPFFCCMAGFLFLFVIVDLQDDLGDLMRSEQGIDIFLYFLYLQPQNLPLVTPMALLLAAMYSFSNLNKNSEITAAKSSGISLTRLSTPAFAFALLISAILFFSSEHLVPSFNAKTDAIQNKMAGKSKEGSRQNFAFHNGDKVIHWSALPKGETLHDLSINIFDKDKKLIQDFVAQTAFYEEGKAWTLKNGQTATYKDGDILGTPRLFKEESFTLIQDSPKDMASYSFDQKFMSLASIQKKLNSTVHIPEKSRLKLETRFYYQTAFPFSCLIAVLLGIPVSVGGQRQAAMVAVVKGLGIMFLYYLSCQAFVFLGNNGVVPPVLAGVLPTIVFIGWGIFELSRKK